MIQQTLYQLPAEMASEIDLTKVVEPLNIVGSGIDCFRGKVGISECIYPGS